VIEDVRKLFVGRRPGEKVELRAGDGLRRAGLLATRDMMAVARSSIEVLGWMENGGRAGQYQPCLLASAPAGKRWSVRPTRQQP